MLAAIDWLAKRPLVDKDRIAPAMGGQAAGGRPSAADPRRRLLLRPHLMSRWRDANPFIRDYIDDLCGPEGLPVRSPILRVAQIDAPVPWFTAIATRTCRLTRRRPWPRR